MFMTKKWVLAVAAIVLLPTALATAAVQLKFNYDDLPEDAGFFVGTNPPNYNGMNWNRDRGDEVDGIPTFPELAGVDGQGVLDAIDFVSGATTGISLTVVSPTGFDEFGPNRSGTFSPGAPASNFFDGEATDTNLWGHGPITFNAMDPREYVEYTIAGLSPTALYDFTFFASRLDVTTNRDTEYKVVGANTDVDFLDPGNNNDNIAQVLQIQPNGAGELSLQIQKGPNNNDPSGFFYLGAFEILENGAVAGQAGDYDGDLDVDGADFLEWQQGNSPNNGNPADLVTWQTNYPVGSLSAVSSVPEPTSALLLVFGLLGLGRAARSRR